MSNAMSRSKSRWKAVLLATVATATVAPLGAKAVTPSLQVSLSLTPLGSVVSNGYTGPTISNGQSFGYKTTEYVAPDAPVNVYVYATIAADAVDASHIAGLEYLYYNVNATNSASTTAGYGTVTAANLNTSLGFNGFGSQNGSIGATSNGLAVGASVNAASLDISGVAKPRTTQAGIFSDHAVADGTNVIVTPTSITYLVETLKYTPNFTPVAANSSSPLQTTTLSVSIPTLPVSYYSANYFADLTTDANGTTTNQLGINSGYTASSANVTLVDAEQGDANLDGIVNSVDAGVLLSNYGKSITGWTNGDLSPDGVVNSVDAGQILSNYGVTYSRTGFTPADVGAAPLALIQAAAGVPEPTSLALVVLGGAALLGRRRTNV